MNGVLQGRIYDIQGFSVQDGPGIRTTVFLKGCPLHCPWCHSPESQAFYPQLSWISMRCTGTSICASRCIKACRKGALSQYGTRKDSLTMEELQLVHVDRNICDNCGNCCKVCHAHALYICGEEYTVDEVVHRVCEDTSFYKHSGGGCTISGGEPLCQAEFTIELLRSLKRHDIHTALDTTGYVPWKTIESALPNTDLFLYDLKHMDCVRHRQTVGVPNELILENAKKIACYGGKLQIRVPIIPLFNDDDENIVKTAEFCKSLGEAVVLVQLLPYHSLGVSKYQRISDKPAFEAVPPNEAKIQHIKSLIQSFGLKTVIH